MQAMNEFVAQAFGVSEFAAQPFDKHKQQFEKWMSGQGSPTLFVYY